MRTLYHGTSSKNVPSIKKLGLEPGHAKGGVVYAHEHHILGITEVDDEREPSVFIAESRDSAIDFAGIAVEEVGGEPVVLVLHVPDQKFAAFSVDEAFSEEPSPGDRAWRTDHLDPSCIVKVEKVENRRWGANDLNSLITALFGPNF